MTKYNFCSGPATLPTPVFEEAAQAVIDYKDSGLSILEISHRSDDFTAIIDEARSLFRELLDVPDSHEILFMQGGASSQFFMVPANFLDSQDKAGYIDTGTWSSKAIKEASRYGTVDVIASAQDKQYTYIPTDYEVPQDLRYLHITSNNTIYGTQFHQLPQTNVPIVADMSSDILSRSIDVSDYKLIYAGAQKNIGTAGVALVVIDRDYMAQYAKDVPSMMSYQLFADRGSLFNTPPVFAIYVSMLTFRWLKQMGGVSAIEKINQQKAKLLYDTIDASQLFYAPVADADRSLMNVVFRMKNNAQEADFLKQCEAADCVTLKGHRSVGGLRASIYNAMPLEGVQRLCSVIKEFDQKHA